MAQPYIGELRMFAGNFAPAGWLFCEGQLLPIGQDYDILFQLLGTTYGGDGQNTFALPDLRGRVPIHQGGGFVLGENGGVEGVTLTGAQLPAHTHTLNASDDTATGNVASNNVLCATTGATTFAYGTDNPIIALTPDTISKTGGSQPHTNFQPYLCVNFIISHTGIFPTPT